MVQSVSILLQNKKLSQKLVKNAQKILRTDYSEEKLTKDFINGLTKTS
jgi:hypothetical protein